MVCGVAVIYGVDIEKLAGPARQQAARWVRCNRCCGSGDCGCDKASQLVKRFARNNERAKQNQLPADSSRIRSSAREAGPVAVATVAVVCMPAALWYERGSANTRRAVWPEAIVRRSNCLVEIREHFASGVVLPIFRHFTIDSFTRLRGGGYT